MAEPGSKFALLCKAPLKCMDQLHIALFEVLSDSAVKHSVSQYLDHQFWTPLCANVTCCRICPMQVQADVSATSTLAEPQLPADVAINERGLDDFDAWDEDTQKQWKRFMKGSRSQEVCQTCLKAIK